MLLPLVTLGIGTFVSLEGAISSFERTENETLEELFPLTHLESLIEQASIPAEDYLRQGDLAERDSHGSTFRNSLGRRCALVKPCRRQIPRCPILAYCWM